jgi:hypothetical protein
MATTPVTTPSAVTYQPQQTLISNLKTENRPLYDFLSRIDKFLAGGVGGGASTTTIVRGGSAGAAPGKNTEVIYNSGGLFFADAGFTYIKGINVVAPAFNSTADTVASPSTTAAFQTSGGDFIAYGDGSIICQEATANTVFNSKGDTAISGVVNTNNFDVTWVSGSLFSSTMIGGNISIGNTSANALYTITAVADSQHLTIEESAGIQTSVPYDYGNAFQTSNGTMAITGSGVGLFQQVIASTTFNSRGDITVTGTVNTSGFNVTWVSGAQFFQGMVGGNIAVGNSLYTVAGFTDATHILLAEPAPTATGVTYDFGNAFQTSQGTMAITASGVGLFQQLIATNTINSRADLATNPATTAAFQTSGGDYVVYGDGSINAQSCAVTTVFNSLGDTALSGTVNTNGFNVTWVSGTKFNAAWVGGNITIGTLLYHVSGVSSATALTIEEPAAIQNGVAYSFGNAFQTHNGTMAITGSGYGLFQDLIVTNTLNSRADLATSPATTASFQNSGGNFVIWGDGHAGFQNLSVNTYYAMEGQTTEPTMPAPAPPSNQVAAIYFNQTGPSLQYNLNDGKGWFPFAGAGAITANQTPWKQNIVAAGFNLLGAGSIDGASVTANQVTANGQLFIGTSSAPLPTSGLATLYFDGTNLFLSEGSGPFHPLLTSGSAVTSIIAGTGIIVNHATGDVTVSANIALIQTPWLQNIVAGGFSLIGAGSITGSSIETNQTTVNGQLFIGTSSAPLPTSGLATFYFDGTHLFLSQGTGAFAQLITAGNVVTSIVAGTGITVNHATGDVTVAANIAAIQTPWLQNIVAGGFALTGAGSITGASITTNQTTVNGQLYIGTTAAPLPTPGLATLFFNGTNLLLSCGTNPFYAIATANNVVSAIYSGHGISVNNNTGAITVSTDTSVVTGVSSSGSVTGSITSNVLYLTGTGVSAVTTTGPGTASIASGTLTINFPSTAVSGVSALYSGHGISLNGNTGAITVSTDTSVVTGVLATSPISASITSNVLYLNFSPAGVSTPPGPNYFMNSNGTSFAEMEFTNGILTTFVQH